MFYKKLFDHVDIDKHITSIYKIKAIDRTTFPNTIMATVPATHAGQFATWYLSIIKQHHTPKKCIVVFDIDDTVIKSSNDAPMRSLVDTYHMCVEYGFDVRVITARVDDPENRRATHDQMAEHGMKVAKSHLYLRPPRATTRAFKESARQAVAKSGRHIVLTIGDQVTDIGPNCGLGILLR